MSKSEVRFYYLKNRPFYKQKWGTDGKEKPKKILKGARKRSENTLAVGVRSRPVPTRRGCRVGGVGAQRRALTE